MRTWMEHWRTCGETLGPSGSTTSEESVTTNSESRERGSHLFYRMPWQGTPLVNIQPARGMAKPYQVRQALKAIDKLEETHG